MWQTLVEFLAVLKFGLELLEKHERVAKLRAEYKLSLYQALKKAKDDAEVKHDELKEKGPEAVSDDVDRMLHK